MRVGPQMAPKVGKGSNRTHGAVKRWGWEMLLGALPPHCVPRTSLALPRHFPWALVKDGGSRVRRLTSAQGTASGSRGDGGRRVTGVPGAQA